MMNYDMTKPLKTLAMEQDVFDVITDALVAECETVDELIEKLDEMLPEYIDGKIINEVATECFNEYYMAKV